MLITTVPSSSAVSEAKRFAVVLAVREFTVTATNRMIASRYAADDAREFLPVWNYTVEEVRAAAGEQLTRFVEFEPITVEVKASTPDSGRERLYSCEASIAVAVDAADAYSAGEAALGLVCEPARLHSQLAAWQNKAFWNKLLPVARGPFEQMAAVVRLRGFDAVVLAGDEVGDQPLVIEVREDGEYVGTLSLIKHVDSGMAAKCHVPVAGLRFIGEHDIEISSIPFGRPNLWFNDAPVKVRDIACLDIPSFHEFFDHVLDQREEARATAAPAALA